MSQWVVRLLGAGLLALALFWGFNAAYDSLRPLEQPGLTLYNRLYPGRTRLVYTDPPGTLSSPKGGYAANESSLARLLGDHEISRPKPPQEYRIVFLGASDLWGYPLPPDQTLTAQLNRLGLRSPDGRQVQSYNLAFVYADLFKDLLILDQVARRGAAPDLAVLTVNINAWNPLLDTHWLATENPDAALRLLETYRLPDLPSEKIYSEQRARAGSWRFFREREQVGAWLDNQFFGLAWGLTGQDLRQPEPFPQMSTRCTYNKPLDPVNRASLLGAFRQFSMAHGVPLLLLYLPHNYDHPAMDEMILSSLSASGLPALACPDLLSPVEFTNTCLHASATGNARLAQSVAAWLETYWRGELSQGVRRCDSGITSGFQPASPPQPNHRAAWTP